MHLLEINAVARRFKGHLKDGCTTFILNYIRIKRSLCHPTNQELSNNDSTNTPVTRIHSNTSTRIICGQVTITTVHKQHSVCRLSCMDGGMYFC